jgi:hypothetical protein
MATTSGMTSAGSAIVTLALVTGNIVKYVGWGTGTTAYAATQTALVTPAAESRATATITQQTTDHTNDTFQAVGTMTCAGALKAITEVGLFDASTSGNMYFRAAFDAMNVDVGDQIQFTIKVKHDHT